jgi:hypothetical protein
MLHEEEAVLVSRKHQHGHGQNLEQKKDDDDDEEEEEHIKQQLQTAYSHYGKTLLEKASAKASGGMEWLKKGLGTVRGTQKVRACVRTQETDRKIETNEQTNTACSQCVSVVEFGFVVVIHNEVLFLFLFLFVRLTE